MELGLFFLSFTMCLVFKMSKGKNVAKKPRSVPLALPVLQVDEAQVTYNSLNVIFIGLELGV